MTAAPARAAYRTLRFAVVLTLVGYVLHRARLTTPHGWQELVATLQGSHLGFLAVSLLVTPLVHLQSTVKWYALTRARGMNVTFRRLYYYFVVGRFYNLILPSNIGGDLIRIRMLGVASGRHADAAATVFVERLTGILTLVVYASIAAAITAASRRLPWLLSGVVILSAALVVMCWALVADQPMRLLAKLVSGRAALIDALVDRLLRLREAIVAFRGLPSAIAVAFGHSAVFYLLCVADIWLTLRVFDPAAPFSMMMLAVPIVMLVMNIPLSVGNVGVLEFAYTVVLGAFGVSPTAALSTVMLMRIKMILAAAGGGVAHALISEATPADGVVPEPIPEKAA
ncbi:MAG TPA: lysylphosphatidylglycerol synthase transmembrane domain-containing protein [Gemmatimonadaceae bacterium]|nr:lysylphosphatidylglycerol synthase transmembrane domain-containing protein [Gemmatimonadaceae bacterium]